jgi:cell division protein FtsX
MQPEVCRGKDPNSLLARMRMMLGLAEPRADECYPRSLFIVTGAVMGIAGVLLSYWGNPANTGFCVSCFLENIAGSIGLHGNIRMQYVRPEIIGFVLGSFVMAGV